MELHQHQQMRTAWQGDMTSTEALISRAESAVKQIHTQGA